jgi:hypothetical protein
VDVEPCSVVAHLDQVPVLRLDQDAVLIEGEAGLVGVAFGSDLHLGGHVQARIAADGLQVHVAEVAQVEQVVVDQLPRGLAVVLTAT